MTSVSLAKSRKWILLLLLLIVTVLLFAWLRRPKGTWVEIMVNGPWDYLPDSKNASGIQGVVLIVPWIEGHDDPVYFSGPHADKMQESGTETRIAPNRLHTLIINKLKGPLDCPQHPTSTSHPYPYPGELLDSQIDAEIHGQVKDHDGNQSDSFVIILPKPCYTTSMREDYSKMGTQQVTNDQSPGLNTTWMSLHYFVTSDEVSSTLDGQSVQFSADAGSGPALSFVMRANTHPSRHNLDCDDKSLMSVKASAGLHGLTGKLYAHFPMLNADGTQTTTYDQDPDCKLSNSGMMLQSRMQTGAQPTKNGLVTAGSGDCHKGQIAFNSALP